jgi:hypothetical protein
MWRAAARQLVDRALGARAAHVIHPILSFSPFSLRFRFRAPLPPADSSRGQLLIRRGTRAEPRKRARAFACDSAASARRVIIWARGSSVNRGISPLPS